MENDDVKALIWQLDASLSIFHGVEWMENVGRVARLKEDFFRCRRSQTVALGAISEIEAECLNRCFGVFVEDDASDRRRAAAFDMAVKLIAALLPEGPGQAA